MKSSKSIKSYKNDFGTNLFDDTESKINNFINTKVEHLYPLALYIHTYLSDEKKIILCLEAKFFQKWNQ